MIKVCVAGATGWTGSAVAQAVLQSKDLQLVAAIARKTAGQKLAGSDVTVVATLDEALAAKPDVLVDYTRADSVKARVLAALSHKIHVVIGASGLSADDYAEIEKVALGNGVGVIAAGNFSVTAALAKRCALLAAEHVPSWEIIDYADSQKIDAPSGTTRELAESLAKVAANILDVSVADTVGLRDARGATVGSTQVHSLRLPGFNLSFETIFGLPGERLSIRHDAGGDADPYVFGTLLAIRRVMKVKGLVRGMDKLLFG